MLSTAFNTARAILDTLSLNAQRLYILLNRGHRLAYCDLEGLFGLSIRQLRRLIKELRAIDVVIESERKTKRFFIPVEHQRQEYRRLTLSDEEIQTLVIAGQAAFATLERTPLARPLLRAFEELLAKISTPELSIVDKQPATGRSPMISIDVEAQRRQWYFGEAPSAPLNAEVFRQLWQAISAKQSIRIDYYAARQGRHWPARQVDPYCLVARSGSWVLVAYCRMRKAIREFNIVDISVVQFCNPSEDMSPYYEVPEGFNVETYFRDRFNLLGGESVHEVRLMVEADRARYFKRKVYHPTQQIESEMEDGRMVVSYEVEGLDEIRSFVQSWGPGITVLEPVELRTIIARQAEEVGRKYE